MNLNNNPIIIGIDHGYGNIKTAHTCFRTGVTVHDREPTFKNDLLIFNGNITPSARDTRSLPPIK